MLATVLIEAAVCVGAVVLAGAVATAVILVLVAQSEDDDE